MTSAPILQETSITTLDPSALLSQWPLMDKEADFIDRSRQTIKSILHGEDERLLMIVGPCSIHHLSSAREYAHKLKILSERVGDKCYLVMRTYFEKPRTIVGWKGMLYDPHLDGSYDIATGAMRSRQFLLELAQLELPAGGEILELTTSHYYTDLLSWGCIGARTCASPPHRQQAAALLFPMGFKNSPDGNLNTPIHGMASAAHPHTYLGFDHTGSLAKIEADGNPDTHLILRGTTQGPNYGPMMVQKAYEQCLKANLSNRLLVDCSHDNSQKKPSQQKEVFASVVEQILQGNQSICGAMIESHLFEGKQPMSPELEYGVSITDPCLDWNSTEQIILEAYHRL